MDQTFKECASNAIRYWERCRLFYNLVLAERYHHQKVKVRDLIRLLESDGWRLRVTKGSHRQFRHPEKPMVVTVPGQLGKDIPLGTLKAILKTAGLESERDKG